jgi:protein AATF/BFR2
VLGNDASDMLKESDEQIFNDHEFYQQLLSDFLAAHEYDEVEEDGEEQDKFLGNTDLSLTQRFLQKKQKMKEAAGQLVKKEVDRKASKNRKIRYVVHEKILNFLVPLQNLKLFEGREAIVSNLFGVH